MLFSFFLQVFQRKHICKPPNACTGFVIDGTFQEVPARILVKLYTQIIGCFEQSLHIVFADINIFRISEFNQVANSAFVNRKNLQTPLGKTLNHCLEFLNLLFIFIIICIFSPSPSTIPTLFCSSSIGKLKWKRVFKEREIKYLYHSPWLSALCSPLFPGSPHHGPWERV